MNQHKDNHAQGPENRPGKKTDPALDRLRELEQARGRLLSMAPEDAMDAILDAPQPMPLVHSFPEEDLYLLVRDIGAEDALPLIELASDRQWDFFMDMEVWDKDRLRFTEVARWFSRFHEADPMRMLRWALTEHIDLFEYFLYRNVELRIREHDEDPADFPGGDWFTFDSVHYLRLRDGAASGADSPEEEEALEALVPNLLERIADESFDAFVRLVVESASVIPSEQEEELLRMKDVRLAEKGFLPFHEAVGVYQPYSGARLPVKRGFAAPASGEVEGFRSARYPAVLHAGGDTFFAALSEVRDPVSLARLQTEFAALCNRIIAADRTRIEGRASLAEKVAKACGYVGIGLEHLAEQEGTGGPASGAMLLQKHFLAHIFQKGYGLAVHLKQTAEDWKKRAWYEEKGLPLTFWGERYLGVLGGLFVRRPLYFDNFETGVIFREFKTLRDVKHTEQYLSDIMALDFLLSRLPDMELPLKNRFFTYKSLLLTLWARTRMGLSFSIDFIPLDRFREFHEALFTGEGEDRQVRPEHKADFLAFLAFAAKAPPADIAGENGPAVSALFSEVEQELSRVPPEGLDPRHIYLFMVA